MKTKHTPKPWELFNPSITHHFAIALQAYRAAISFGVGTSTNIINELKDHRINIEDPQLFELLVEFERKKTIFEANELIAKIEGSAE